jgi:autotransporter-associated beta strand protein
MGTFKPGRSGIDSRRCRSRRVRRAIAIAVAVVSVQAYERFTTVCEAASNVTLTDGDKGSTTSFTGTSNHWSASADATLPAGSAPNASYTYEVLGSTATASLLRTPSSSATFGGLSLQIDDGADLLLKTSGTVTVNNLILNGGVVETDDVSGTILAGNITLNPGTTSYINADSGNSVTVTAPITNTSGALTINGYDSLFASNATALYSNSPNYRADNPPAGVSTGITGTVTLSASNSYTGLTTLHGGTLSLNNANALAGGGNITFTGGTLQFTGNNTNDYSTQIVNSTKSISIDTNGQNVTFAGVLASSNTGGLTKNGNGTLYLSNSGSGGEFSGGITLNAGMLNVNGIDGFGTAPGSAAVSITFAGNSTLQFATGFSAFSSFNSNRTISIPTAGVTGTIDTNGFSNMTVDQLVTGNGTLGKAGIGTLSLTVSNTYTGGTTISGGTLRANNAAALSSGNVSIASGGTLGGSGGGTGAVTVNSGGTITAGADGSTIGTLTTGAQTWSNGGIYAPKLANASIGDALVINGAVTLSSSPAVFNINPSSATTLVNGANNQLWEIADIKGGLTNYSGTTPPSSTPIPVDSSQFALTVPSSIFSGGVQPAGSSFTLELASLGGSEEGLYIAYNTAPEPGSGVFVVAGVVPMLARRRRMRSR